MPRDDSAETSPVDKDNPTDAVSRRSYLKAAAGTAGLFLVTRSATAQTSYETITVGQDQHRAISVGSGETFANKLIDITADGATFRIEATGSDWAIRNVGVKGVWDVYSDGHEQGISARVDSGSTAVIDNFYFADGCPDDTYPGVTGIYVQRSHAGTLRINSVNIQDMPNNAIYASTPGYPEDNPFDVPGGGQGAVEITNSYAADCQASHFRIGTAGSFVENCVAVDGNRGVWAKFNPVEIRGCDLSGATTSRADGDLVCGHNSDWGSDADPAVDVTDTYYGTSAPGDQGINYPGTIQGDSIDSVRRTSPDAVAGVPTSPVEAASGGSSSDGSDGDGSSSDGSDGDGSSSDGSDGDGSTTSEFRIETAAEAPSMSYEFVVDGEIVRGVGTEDADTWSSSDGLTTATGSVGNGYGDGYEIAGTLTDWTADISSDQYTLLLNGTEVDPTNISEPKSLTIESTADAPLVEYEFTVDGSVTKGTDAEDAGSIAADDLSETDGTVRVTGSTGRGFADDYEFQGSLLAWDASVDESYYTVRVDGEEVDADTI